TVGVHQPQPRAVSLHARENDELPVWRKRRAPVVHLRLLRQVALLLAVRSGDPDVAVTRSVALEDDPPRGGRSRIRRYGSDRGDPDDAEGDWDEFAAHACLPAEGTCRS